MRHEKVVEGCLNQIAAGKREFVANLLPLLCDEILFTPVVMFENLGDSRGTNRIRIASFPGDGKKIVPVFTSEELFLEWSDGKYQCFSVAGGDLALTLPKESWLVINPGRENSVELDPEEIIRLSQAVPCSVETESPFPLFGAQRESQEISEQPESPIRELAFDADEFRRYPFPESEEEPFTEIPPQEVDMDELTDYLGDLLSGYPEVEEAYFHEPKDGNSRAALGLLLQRVPAERRFLLIDSIAEISRRYFGVAGAIEVFDDLYVTSSKSWELFSPLTPFYVKDDERAARRPSGLKLEHQFFSKSAGDISYDKESESAWQSVKKTGSRVLGALRFGSRD